MKYRKVYGQSKINRCPFCDRQATTENKQGVPTCLQHKKKYLDLKCACGSWLEIRKGKFGVFCSCIECGNINFNKALEVNKDLLAKLSSKTSSKVSSTATQTKKKEPLIVTSDEVDFLY